MYLKPHTGCAEVHLVKFCSTAQNATPRSWRCLAVSPASGKEPQ
ncbi:hypothetical protein OOU_Y34scaffold00969g2 [Pyricularia oryzae Y34]|uniref:Uncharacterized protein n=3 Tax=Pyricularia oryzae TaxID=318829 RepID=Q2KH29_PYRO7|nr:hypothetical protein MGCH7_ch7g156 [Pyricularia oryzae 70-15]ELQ33317.1 hypothetical protein OOU_Y34scaffold00969g2 [Pyricularia oryzae Y34]